ncbi:MAG: AAA family ATPase, partial [Chitinivibrionales bacterium]|nr:AAA family ATPase [Chitinivibrionales bacterium]
MNRRILGLLTMGECRTVEFKAARRALNRDLYETVCAFLNRDGGDILLGVDDDGTIRGVQRSAVVQMKQDFANMVNNSQVLNPPSYLSIEDVEHAGATLLHIAVPPSSQVHRCKGRIYDRNEDGDYDITDNQTLVTRLYVRKQSSYSENIIFPYAELTDLRPELIERARRLAGGRQKGHPWIGMSDQELLTSAQLWQRDFQRGVDGYTLAAILLFGKDSTILSVLPHHRTDALVRRENVDRYDDRDDVRTNLLDSHDRLFAFGEKHLSDPFYLEGDQRVSLRSIVLREIIGNLLIHREYSQAFPAKFVIERDRLFTENGNKPHGHGTIDPRLFSPFPKNPAIARVFKEIGWADELGSGVRNLFHYGRFY